MAQAATVTKESIENLPITSFRSGADVKLGGYLRLVHVADNGKVSIVGEKVKDEETGDYKTVLAKFGIVHPTKGMGLPNIFLKPEDKKLATLREFGIEIADPGFKATSVGKSEITYINGKEGKLYYRGYPIEQLAEKKTFPEVAYLLLGLGVDRRNGHPKLPNQKELKEFNEKLVKIASAPEVKETLEKLSKGMPARMKPMDFIQAAFSVLNKETQLGGGAVDPESRLKHSQEQAIRAIALMPLINAYAYRQFLATDTKNLDKEKPITYDPNKSYTENYMHMMHQVSGNNALTLPESIKAMEASLIVHADHEMNASTTTARTIASAGASVFSSISGAVGALSGPLHGGANAKMLKQLRDLKEMIDARISEEQKKKAAEQKKKSDEKVEEVKLSEEEIENIKEQCIKDFVQKSVDNKTLIMGIGHRVYKASDPRAPIMTKLTKELRSSIDDNNGDTKNKKIEINEEVSELIDIADKLEQAAADHEHFKKRKIYPNVDFRSSTFYSLLGLPQEMMTAQFVSGRVAGWASHIVEVTKDGPPITRPRQCYVGPAPRDLPGGGDDGPIKADGYDQSIAA